MILALVTIVMLVMLGAAYLQVARTDRRTAAAVDTRTNQSDASILRYIGQILAGDVPEGIDGTGPEPFDVAWSNPASPRTVPDQFAPTVVPGPKPILTNGDQPAREPRASTALGDRTTNYALGAATGIQAQGGDLDDTWLGATEPDFTGATPIWAHVTDLSGVFLDLFDIALTNDRVPGSDRLLPAQYLATAAGVPGTPGPGGSDVAYTVPAVQMGTLSPAELGVYADADGDDIADSRWTWAPLPSDGGQAYVMAVRILDNSALLNINALAFRRPSLGTEPPRWLWPGELDLDTALEGVKLRAGAGMLTSTNILGNTAPTGRNMAGDTFADRLDNWLFTVNNNRTGWDAIGSDLEQKGPTAPGIEGGETPINDPGNTYNSYNVRSEELELRWRNGLNRSTDNTTADAATSMETLDAGFFRSGALEGDYVASGYGAAGNTSAAIGPFFFNEPRKQLTTISGSAAFGQVDLNDAGLNQLANAIDAAPMNFGAAATTPRLVAFGGWASKAQFADQFAAVLADFRDDDSELTYKGQDAANGMFGMEYLPFISEVYLQARYNKGTLTPAATSASGNDEVEWNHTAGNFAVAIEIVNPWPWPIAMPDVEVFVQDDAGLAESWGTLDTLTAGQATIDAYEIITLRKEDAGGDSTELPAGTTITTPVPDWPVGGTQGVPVLAGVVLAAQTNVGDRIGYQEFVVESIPPTIIEEYTPGAGTAAGDPGYAQVVALGTGNGINALTVRDVDVDVEVLDPNNSLPRPGRRVQHSAPQDISGTSEFGNYLKAANSPDRSDLLDTRVTDAIDASLTPTPAAGDEPWIIGNAGRFYRTGDLLRAVCLGPRIVAGVQIPVAEVWEEFRVNSGLATHSIASLMLNVDDPAVVQVAPSELNIPHAAYYLALFNTIDVNNGGGGLIDGRPNINTMPERLLAEILPTTNVTYAQNIANEIAVAREDPNNAGTGVGRPAALKGIALTSQLGFLNSVYNGTSSTAAEAIDFNELEPGITHAFNPTTGAGSAPTTDAFIDDNEEKTLLLNYMNQVVSTRSDIFTAYVLVRSYPANDFTLNGYSGTEWIPTNEYRLIAVFDRSQVTGDGLPRILAVKRFADN